MRLLLSAILLTSFISLGLQDGATLVENERTLVFHYSAHPEQLGQLFLPDKPALELGYPVVILIHGGCWQALHGLEGMQTFADRLTNDGLAVWNLEYRRLGNGGGWPMTFLDVALGADYLKSLAESYPLDLSKVIAVGHSAGGHLALWLGARPKLPTTSELYTNHPLELKAVMSLAGITTLSRSIKENICGKEALSLMGGSPEEHPERFREVALEAFLPLDMPSILIHGKQDRIVSLRHVKPFLKEASRTGSEVEFISLAETAHFDLVVTSSSAWQHVRHTVLEYLDK